MRQRETERERFMLLERFISKKSRPNEKSKDFFPIFPSRSFINLGFTFRYIIHFRFKNMMSSFFESLIVSAPFLKKTILSL